MIYYLLLKEFQLNLSVKNEYIAFDLYQRYLAKCSSGYISDIYQPETGSSTDIQDYLNQIKSLLTAQ